MPGENNRPSRMCHMVFKAVRSAMPCCMTLDGTIEACDTTCPWGVGAHCGCSGAVGGAICGGGGHVDGAHCGGGCPLGGAHCEGGGPLCDALCEGGGTVGLYNGSIH